ncbi:hypothetical protein [Arthrobacter sp. AL12]|uniref:hypothetical protein n=1 Tax=Arthrobacter sp. AL12 TaxID=3042241 RepID=UPI002499BAFC|nr:hypothetical protein [Arthrobacter sp. AL12]MDI3212797.1 hypothetical protein [Arthrobacter sp. AL12]
MGKFRGWHIVAGIAAMVLTGILGNSMGLNNTAAFMSSCVAFVAVSMWMDSRISLRRRERARETAREADGAAAADDAASAPDRQLEAERPKREGRGT